MSKKEKTKYSSEYISYVKNGDSAAVFITRDIAKQVNTNGKWIDIIDSDGFMNTQKKAKWDFSRIVIELFPRITKPVYPDKVTNEEIDYITWKTARNDIVMLRQKGYKGQRFEIRPELINENDGKYKTIKAMWNNTFQCWVPMQWKTSSCVIKERRFPIKAKWEYRILSVKRIK